MGGLAGFCRVLPFAKAAEAADRPPAIAWRPVLAQTDDEYHDLLFDQEAGTRRTDDVRSLHSRVPDRRRLGVVCTIRPGGRPRQSVTYYVPDGDRVLISIESKRGKARDVIRDGWASICVMGQEAPYLSVTVEGPACIRTAGIGQASARIFVAISGNQALPLSDEDLARLDRVVLEITCARVYGASHLPAAE